MSIITWAIILNKINFKIDKSYNENKERNSNYNQLQLKGLT